MVCNPPTNIFTGSYDDVLKTYYYPGNNRSMDSCTEFDAVMKKTEKRKFKFWLFAKMMWLKMKSVACLRRYVRVSRIKVKPQELFIDKNTKQNFRHNIEKVSITQSIKTDSEEKQLF